MFVVLCVSASVVCLVLCIDQFGFVVSCGFAVYALSECLLDYVG